MYLFIESSFTPYQKYFSYTTAGTTIMGIKPSRAPGGNPRPRARQKRTAIRWLLVPWLFLSSTILFAFFGDEADNHVTALTLPVTLSCVA